MRSVLSRTVSVGANATNTIYYCAPAKPNSSCCETGLAIYFGGDIQDGEKAMRENLRSKDFANYCLENAARKVSECFPQSHVMVVRPAAMVHGGTFR